MTNQAKNQQLAALRRRTGSLCQVWRVNRADGGSYRFTTANQKVDTRLHEQHNPSPGIITFANRREVGTKDATTELHGLIDTGESQPVGITFEDCRARRLLGATLTQELVNWEFPFADPLVQNAWLLQDFDFNEREWQFRLAGLTADLKVKLGDIHSRQCQNDLGVFAPIRSYCPVDVNVWPLNVLSCSVTGDTTPDKRTITIENATGGSGLVDPVHDDENYFAFGRIRVTQGTNSGLEELVEASVKFATGKQTITLSQPMPFAFAVSDVVTIWVGCDKTAATCIAKFNAFQGINFQGGFRGFPDIPGTDALLRNPSGS